MIWHFDMFLKDGSGRNSEFFLRFAAERCTKIQSLSGEFNSAHTLYSICPLLDVKIAVFTDHKLDVKY